MARSADPVLVLHYAPDNASLIVRLVLEEMGLPYRPVLVDRSVRAQKSPPYLALNPQGLIPVLETPDGPLFETAAICLWLADRTGRMAPGVTDANRGNVLKWLFFAANTLHPDLKMQFYPDRYAPDPTAIQPLTTARLRAHFHLLDAQTGQDWFGGATPSILDCYVAVCMRWAALYTAGAPRWFDAADYPGLHAMASRLETRPSARAAALAEGLGPLPFTDPRPCRPTIGSAI